jgi:hypothetical protein
MMKKHTSSGEKNARKKPGKRDDFFAEVAEK